MEIEGEEFNKPKHASNSFLRQIAQVFQSLSEEYFEIIRNIEQNYLKGKIITLPFLQKELMHFQDSFLECIDIIKKTKNFENESDLLDLFFE